MKPLLTLGAVLVAATTLTGCSDGAVSADRLGRAVGTAYQRLYVVQQHDLGRTEVTPPDRAATCTRGGTTAHSGSGSWVCTVHFPYPDGHLVPLSFDVDVQPIGCYTATGPPAIVGQLTLASPAGASLTNPLFAFDGCLATG